MASEGQLTIALDIEVTPELKAEGVARELINRIQNIRKDSGFEVTDKVSVEIYAGDENFAQIESSLATYKDYLASQTLAVSVEMLTLDKADDKAVEVEWGDEPIKIKVTKQQINTMAEENKTRYTDEELAEAGQGQTGVQHPETGCYAQWKQ